MIVLKRNQNLQSSKGELLEWSWLACPRCGGVVSIQTSPSGGVQKIVPTHKEDLEVKHLPPNVAEYYANAKRALEAQIPSSAAVELRRTLEAAAQHHGIEERPLVRAIEKMTEEGLITKNFNPVLGHVKQIGNQGAHASDETLSEDQVRVALRFTTQVLRNLFEIPAELTLLNKPLGPKLSSSDIKPASPLAS